MYEFEQRAVFTAIQRMCVRGVTLFMFVLARLFNFVIDVCVPKLAKNLVLVYVSMVKCAPPYRNVLF